MGSSLVFREIKVKCFNKLDSNNDVVDWDVDQFDKEADETHDGETNCCGNGNLLEF